LLNELGDGRTDNIEVWHMPGPGRFAFGVAEAMAALRRVLALLARMVPDVPGA
jgi:hypothetical protein